MNTLLNVIKSFLSSVDTMESPPVQVVSMDQDSQDYGDASFLEEFAAAQDQTAPFPSGVIISTICTHLYQVIANIFATATPTPENLSSIIDNWILGISILIRHRQQEWTTFLQYGGDWERLRSTNSRTSRAWCPYILTRVLLANPDVYFQGRDHFISAWFESIIEPDLERQHAFTALLLNIDDGSMVVGNSLFAKNSAGMYEITSDALFEARPALIVCIPPEYYTNIDALANLGRHFDSLERNGDRAAITLCKQRYLDYLHRMLSSMKSIYLVTPIPHLLTPGHERYLLLQPRTIRLPLPTRSRQHNPILRLLHQRSRPYIPRPPDFRLLYKWGDFPATGCE
jgi:hypothetical protein